MRKFLLASTLLFVSGGYALAADAPVEEVVVVDEAFNWSGVDAGVQGGMWARRASPGPMSLSWPLQTSTSMEVSAAANRRALAIRQLHPGGAEAEDPLLGYRRLHDNYKRRRQFHILL